MWIEPRCVESHPGTPPPCITHNPSHVPSVGSTSWSTHEQWQRILWLGKAIWITKKKKKKVHQRRCGNKPTFSLQIFSCGSMTNYPSQVNTASRRGQMEKNNKPTSINPHACGIQRVPSKASQLEWKHADPTRGSVNIQFRHSGKRSAREESAIKAAAPARWWAVTRGRVFSL